MSLEKEFTPYELALELKELGFDEPCICCYDIEEKVLFHCLVNNVENNTLIDCTIGLNPKEDIKAPTFSQAFRWFRKKYFLFGQITIAEYELENNGFEYEIKSKDKSIDTWRGGYKTSEEAELECLKKLIEIVKEK